MNKFIVAAAISIGLLFSSQAFACGIQGSAKNKDGSKIDGTATISTSWNSEKAFPKNGTYSLELGKSICGEKITVYIDGNQGQEVRIGSSGLTNVSFVRR